MNKYRHLRAVPLRLGALALALIASAHAGSYSTDFSTDPTLPSVPANQRLALFSNLATSNANYPGHVATGGNPGGYFSLTDNLGTARSTIVFPDFESGFVVGSFAFAVDCRIGGGTLDPADGFSINFVSANDPLITNGGTAIGGELGYAGSVNNGHNEANRHEEGSKTGIGIGFDAYYSGGSDVIGISVRVDNVLLREVSLPTKNGTAANTTSLQTGLLIAGTSQQRIDALGWARTEVNLKPDGRLDVFWKGVKVIDNLATGYTPRAGRLVFGARTGGSNQVHHFDNLTLTTQPVPRAAVTSATLINNVYSFQITDFAPNSIITTNDLDSLSIDGVPIAPGSLTISKANGVTTVSYTSPTPLPPNTISNYEIVFRNNGNAADLITGTGTLTTAVLPAGTIPGPPGSVGVWAIREFRNPPEPPNPGDPTVAADSIQSASQIAVAAAAGTFVENTNVAVLNHSDPDTNGPANSGNFNNDFPVLVNTPAAEDGWVVVAKTKVSIPAAGIYTFSVHSDDGFALRIDGGAGGRFNSVRGNGAIDPRDNQVIFLDGGTADSDTRGVYQFDAAGTYDITYLGWDDAPGGGFYELAWAPGNFQYDRDTTTWTLVGTPTHPSVTAIPYRPRFVTPLPGPAATAGNFSIRTYRDAFGIGSITQADDFVRTTTRSGTDVDGLTIDTFRPSLNASDPQTSNVAGAFPKEPFPGNTGAADDNVLTVAKARITIPTTATYTFWVQGDDGFRLSIKSTNGSADPPFQRATQGGDDAAARLQMSNPNEIFFENGTGNADTRGIILLQAGTYDLEFNHWEGNGGFYYELSAAVGSFPHGTGGGNFQLVGSATGIQLVAQPSVGTPPGTRIPVSNFTTNGSPVSSVTLTFGSETGRTYKIQASTNLATWTDVETATPASGTGTNTNTVTLAAFPALNGQPSLFFRVIVN